MQQNALIIFVKNPVLAEQKTRLVSDKKQLDVLKHINMITKNLSADKWVFYSDFVDENDLWANDIYQKALQLPMVDIGEKTANAFWDMIQEGYEKVIILGNESVELTEVNLSTTYEQLVDNQVVIQKSNAGNYALMGFNFEKFDDKKITETIASIFLNKEWNHDKVYENMIDSLTNLRLRFAVLN